MGKQKIDISVFDEAVKKVDVSAFDEAVKKKEPSASSELPLQSQEEVSVSVGEGYQRNLQPPTVGGDITTEQGKIEVPSVLTPIEYEPADFGSVNPAALYGDFQANERSLGQINQTLSKYEQAQSQVRTDGISFGRNTQADLSSEISQLKKDRQKIMEQQKNLSNRLLNPVVKEASQFYLNEDGSVKEQYYKENFYGMKVPNIERINDLAGERIEDKGLRVKLAEKIQGDIDFNLNIDQEKLASLAKEKIKSKLKDIQGEREELFESQYGKDVANAYASAVREIKSVSDIYGGEYKEKAIEIDSELKQITTDYEAYSTELKNKEYTTQDEVDQANQLLQKAYGDYQKSYSDAVTKNAQLLNAYNAKINKRAQEVQAIYQEKVNQMSAQFGKDNPIPSELIDKAYQEALSEQMDKVKEGKEFVVSQGGLPLRFGTSTLSSFGSFLEMVGATFGGDGETGKQMQQYFQPAVDPIKGFRDLTLYNLVESSGNLAGSMIPSVTAAAAAAATTKNLSASARLLSTALAGFTSETADLMGRSYRDALKRSGSVEEAKNAATETFNSQLVLAPTYVLDVLPFVGGIKGIKNPMLRFGANGLLEYTTETFLQEYPQNIMERAIAETGDYENAPSFASLESLLETSLNTLPTILFGGATAAISSESTATPTPDQFIQNLEKVLRNEGGDAASRLITELYSGGKITEDEMGMLASILEDIDINNSEQYNAIRYRRGIVNEAISNEPDEAKKKKMKKYVKAYDDILERILGGEEVTIPKQKIGGQEYYSVPNNPISFLDNLNKKDNEKVQQEDQELREQEGEVKKEEERIRQEEQARVLEEFDAVEDNETVTITSKTLEEIPEQFRDRAEKVEGVEVETKKTFLGIPYGKAESTTVGDGYRYNATGEEIRNAINQEEQTIVADEKASIKEPVLEKPQDGGVQKEGEQESAELRSEEESSIEKIARVSGVKAKNIRGLYDINRKMWGLNRVKALAVSVIQDRTIGNQAKRTVVYEENGVEKLGVLDKRQEGGKVRINIGTNANPVYKVVTPKKVGISKEEMYSKIQFKKGEKAPSGALKQEAPIFKSTAQEGIGKIQQKAATPEQWVKMITDKGGKGTTQELEWIGLQDYLNDWKKENNSKSVPKEVVEQYINDNQIEIVDVAKLDVNDFNYSNWNDSELESDFEIQKTGRRVLISNDGYKIIQDKEGGYDLFSPDGKKIVEDERSLNQIKERYNDVVKKAPTKHSQYTLEGGENYREVLLMLPNNKKSSQNFYKKEHWEEANILAHLRLNERTLPNGERVLFIEEVQSDWAQEGKKKGFGKREKITENDIEIISDEKRYYDEKMMGYNHRVKFKVKGFDDIDSVSYNDGLNSKERSIGDLKKRLVDDYNRELLQEGRVPDMPYKKTDQWVGMAMRRVFKMAADEGFNRVAWVTGEQSADRYDLSKQVDTVGYNGKKDGTYDVVVKDFGGRDLLNKNMTIDEIESTLGKEVANKIQSNEHGDDISTTDAFERQIWEENGYVTEGVLEGENLKVGGEGMKAFYNSILPKVAKKEAQRFDKKADIEVVDFRKREGFVLPTSKPNQPSKQLSIAITPEMRMNLNSAVPLFQGEQGAMLAGDGNYIIYALTDPNVSTPLHELAHVYEHYLTEQERKDIIKWAGHKEWTTETSEKFARGFEKYLSEGKAPTPALQKYFDNFKNWLLEIYNGIVGSDIDIELNAPMRKIYDNMFSQDGAKKTTSIASETQGLTEKERFVQGFKEIMSAKDEKIRQAKESVKEKLSQARAKFGERMSAQRKKTREAKTARAELGRLINLEMKELGLSDVRASRVKSMLSSMKNITPNNIDSVIERAYGLVVAEAKAQRLNTYKKKSKEAKRRIQRGDFDTVSVGMIPLMELDVRAILDEDIKRYTELVDDFSRRGKFAVEDVAAKIQEANEIVNRAAEQLGLREVEASNIAQGLTEENYNKAISELVASGDITQDMADFMRANKKRLLELEKKPVNKEQVFFEIQDKIEFVKNNQQDLSDRPVKQKAQDVISSVKREDLENMSDADLSLLNRVLDAMEVGLMPSQASKLAQTIEAQRTANSINKQTQQEKSTVGKMFEAIDTPIRELASGKAKRVRRQMIKSQSTTADSSFGFKGKAISKALEPFNIAYGELEAQANKYKGMLARAIKNIKKSQASDIRGFLYMAEMHRNANPQSNKAYTVKQFIDVLTGTTEARETYISNYGEKRYKEILKTYDKFKDENGELDAKKLYESMSKSERDYVSTAEIIFSENTEFARDARWVRGESFEELNYYMHYPVVMQASKSDVNASVDNMMNSGIVRPSTKAGNLEERTEGVKLVSFSLAESVQNSYQQTLEDYYLTQPLRTERKAFNMFEKMNSNNDKMFSFASGVNKGAEDFRRYLLVSKQVSNFNNPITNAIKAGAYRYMLGSTARAVKEVLSNQAYVAMSDLVNFETASFKSFEIAKKTLTEPDWLFKAVANLPISDKQRILGNAVFAGQADAATMLGEDVGFTARAQSLETRIGKGIEAMQDLGITVNIKANRIRISNKAYMEALFQTPDMFYSRGVFFDKLQRAYKKETGESLDLDKLTDKKFINDNRVLFDKITKEASAAVRKAFSTTNLAERSGVQLKASAEGGMFNAVKYFMLPFVINEYEQLRMAAVEDGLFGGLKTAIPILSRFAVYGALTGALTRAIAAAVSDEDEPIEDILPSKDEFMKSLISSVVTLTLQRNWTFAPRAASNYVIEYLNKEFGEGITRESKEYDKFKDNIMFNRMNLDDVMGMRWTEMAQIIAPQYSPLLSSYEAAMKSTDERNKQRKEYLEWKALVTALAGLGFLPRDVRDIYIYSNEDVRDLIFEDKKKGVSGTIKGGSSSRALSGGSGTTIKGSAR